jgi:hypothetical protein
MGKDVVKYKIDSIKKLKEVGFQEIYEKSFISVSTLRKLLNREFEEINSVHFKGFVKVLRREYPLIDWKEYEDSFNRVKAKKADDKPKDLLLKEIESEKRKKRAIIYTLLALVIILSITSLKLYFDKKESVVEVSEPTQIEDVFQEDENLSSFEIEDNLTEQLTLYSEENTTKSLEKDDILIKRPNTLKVEAFDDVWLGRVMLDKKIKKSSVVSANETVELNGTRDQLLYFGHSQMKIYYKYGVIAPNHSKRSYYRYVDGDIEEISRKKFIELNGGKVW